MPRAHDPRGVSADRLPTRGMGGRIPDFGQYQDWDDPLGRFIENLLQQIKDVTGIDLFWMLDWSWTTNTLMELVRQANDLTGWLQNPIQRPPNLLSRPSFSSPSAIAAAPDWSWDAVVSLGTLEGPYGVMRTDPQGSARTTADGGLHSMLSNAIGERSVLGPGQILTCQVHVLVEDGFTAADDEAIRLELVPSRLGALQEPVVLASCGVPEGESTDWIAAPVGSKAVFFDADWVVPEDDTPDTVELRLVVSDSAGGNVAVWFDGARVAAAGGFLVVLADLFDAGRIYLTELWSAVTVWFEDIFDAEAWSTLKTDTDAAFDAFVRRVKRALRHADAELFHPPGTSDILSGALRSNPWFGWLFEMVDDWLRPVLWASKAVTDFGDSVWAAVTVFVSNPLAEGAWSTLTDAFTEAWNTLVDAVLEAWGSPRTHSDFPNPGTALPAVLRHNNWFGWLFDLVDDWLQPVLKIGKAVSDFGDAVWHAITAFVSAPGAAGAWSTLTGAIDAAWDAMVDDVLGAWGSEKTHEDFASPGTAATAALRNNAWFGWLFDLVDGWLQPVLTVGKAVTDFGDALWHAITAFASAPGASGAWSTLKSSIDTAWNTMVDDVLAAWGSSKTHADFASPAAATEAALKNNPITGWIFEGLEDVRDFVQSLFGGTSDGKGYADILPKPAGGVVNQVPSNLRYTAELNLGGSLPSGNLYYCVTAIVGGVETPASAEVLYFGAGLGTVGMKIKLEWDALADATAYRVYRRIKSLAGDVTYRRIATTSSSTLTWTDSAARTAGSSFSPPSGVSRAISAVSAVSGVADAASSAASAAGTKANSIATSLYGSTTVGSTINVGALPNGIFQSKIQNLEQDLDSAIVGCGISVGRTSTSTTNIPFGSTDGVNVGTFGFPAGFFNATPTWKTDNITFGTVTVGGSSFSGVQVTDEGLYICELSLDTNADQGGRFGVGFAVSNLSNFVTGTIMSGNTFTPIYRIQSAVAVHVPANGVIVPVFVVVSNQNIAGITFKGESTGLVTRFSVSRLGNIR